MCGIVGFISNRRHGFQLDDLKFFGKALVVDGLNRGMDSTGIYTVFEDSSVTSFKNNVNAMMFQDDHEYDLMLRETLSSGRIIIGHNRAATKGSITARNAHPFHVDNICLVHNGTLWNHEELAKTEVDSEAIAVALSKDTPQNVLPRIRGAFALVWFDQKENALFFIRNSDRPLSIAELPGGLFLSSEGSLTEYLALRQKEKISEIREIPTEMLFKYSMDDGRLTWEKLPLASTVVYYQQGTTGNSRYQSAGTATRTTTTTATAASATNGATTSPSNDDMKGVYERQYKTVSDQYKVGDVIQVKIDRISSDATLQSHRLRGRTIEPGRCIVDISGTVRGGDVPDSKWYGNGIVGKVSHISTSNCGVSIFLTEMRQEVLLKTKNGTISAHEWRHVCAEEPCTKCAAVIDPDFHEVTSVSRTGLGENSKYRVTCPTCVEKSIISKDLKNDHSNQIAAVQERVAKRTSTESVTK